MDSLQSLDKSSVKKMGCQSNFKNRMVNSEDLDETAHYELSHQDLNNLHRNLFWSAELKQIMSSIS